MGHDEPLYGPDGEPIEFPDIDDGEAPPGDLDALNPAQSDAVREVSGPMVVFAGAGSGKTRVITFRIANLLAVHRVPPYRVLAVTFTNKAAGEMKRRLQGLVGEDLARDLWVGTFHATCARILRRHHDAAGLQRNFVVYDDDDGRAVMRRVYKELKLDDKRFPPRAVLGKIRAEKQEGRLPPDFVAKDPFERVVAQAFEAYERHLAAANAVDFDDLLLRVLHIVEDASSAAGADLRGRFRHVLVDEFQDVNRVQYRIVRALSAEYRNLCVVGDDDQSIYRWRGADVTIVRNFRRDYPDAQIVKLEQNYRSTGSVVAAALGVIKPAQDREPKELFTENEPGDPVLLVAAATERDEAAWVVERVQELLSGGASADELAVFYRTHAQSRVLEELMRAERIPHQVIGGFRFFERAEVKDLLSYLRVVDNPRSDVDFLRIVNVPARSIGDTTIERLSEVAAQQGSSLIDAVPALVESGRIKGAPKRALAELHELLVELMSRAKTSSPLELAEEVLERSGYKETLERDDSTEAEARLLNLGELMSAIHEHEEEMAAAGEVATLGSFLERVTLSAAADDLKDQPKVALMTVHAAKGLEFAHVFLTGMEEDTFPFKSQDPDRRCDLEEERRLAYVAVTRARERLYVTHVATRTLYGQMRYSTPSRFLSDLPAEVVRHESTAQKKAAARRSIDTPGWGGVVTSRAAVGAPKLAWSAGGRFSPEPSAPRAPGERYFERDDEASSSTLRGASREGLRAVGLVAGSRVAHKSFGLGVVIDVDTSADPTATVRFEGWGQKRVKVRFLDAD